MPENLSPVQHPSTVACGCSPDASVWLVDAYRDPFDISRLTDAVLRCATCGDRYNVVYTAAGLHLVAWQSNDRARFELREAGR